MFPKKSFQRFIHLNEWQFHFSSCSEPKPCSHARLLSFSHTLHTVRQWMWLSFQTTRLLLTISTANTLVQGTIVSYLGNVSLSIGPCHLFTTWQPEWSCWNESRLTAVCLQPSTGSLLQSARAKGLTVAHVLWWCLFPLLYSPPGSLTTGPLTS